VIGKSYFADTEHAGNNLLENSSFRLFSA
jgi:hypothetical protein